MIRPAVVLAALLFSAACRWGPRPESAPPSPRPEMDDNHVVVSVDSRLAEWIVLYAVQGPLQNRTVSIPPYQSERVVIDPYVVEGYHFLARAERTTGMWTGAG